MLSSTVNSDKSLRPSGTTATPAAPDALRPGPGKVATVQEHGSGPQPQHAGHRQHQARLARSVRAEQRGDFTGRDVDRHIPYDGAIASQHAEPSQAQDICRGRPARSGPLFAGRDEQGACLARFARVRLAHATSSVPR